MGRFRSRFTNVLSAIAVLLGLVASPNTTQADPPTNVTNRGRSSVARILDYMDKRYGDEKEGGSAASSAEYIPLKGSTVEFSGSQLKLDDIYVVEEHGTARTRVFTKITSQGTEGATLEDILIKPDDSGRTNLSNASFYIKHGGSYLQINRFLNVGKRESQIYEVFVKSTREDDQTNKITDLYYKVGDEYQQITSDNIKISAGDKTKVGIKHITITTDDGDKRLSDLDLYTKQNSGLVKVHEFNLRDDNIGEDVKEHEDNIWLIVTRDQYITLNDLTVITPARNSGRSGGSTQNNTMKQEFFGQEDDGIELYTTRDETGTPIKYYILVDDHNTRFTITITPREFNNEFTPNDIHEHFDEGAYTTSRCYDVKVEQQKVTKRAKTTAKYEDGVVVAEYTDLGCFPELGNSLTTLGLLSSDPRELAEIFMYTKNDEGGLEHNKTLQLTEPSHLADASAKLQSLYALAASYVGKIEAKRAREVRQTLEGTFR